MLILGYSRTFGGPSLPTPVEVVFDGTNDYLVRGAALTGALDTQLMTVYLRFKWNGLGPQYLFLADGTPDVMEIFFDAQEQLHFILYNAAGTAICNVETVTNVSDNTEHEVFFSYNGVTGVSQLYLDGVSDKNQIATTTGTVNWSAMTNFSIGAFPGGTVKYGGSQWRMTVWDDTAEDCSILATRNSMADETQASSIGNNIVDMFGAAVDWNAGSNWGTGGNFTMNGAVV